jgi:hypothetical protein
MYIISKQIVFVVKKVSIMYSKMNYALVYLFIGFVIGYFIYVSMSDTIHYHGLNSKLVKQTAFIYGNKKIQFVPKIKEQ